MNRNVVEVEARGLDFTHSVAETAGEAPGLDVAKPEANVDAEAKLDLAQSEAQVSNFVIVQSLSLEELHVYV